MELNTKNTVMNTNVKLMQKIFFFLSLSFALCTTCACSDSDEAEIVEVYQVPIGNGNYLIGPHEAVELGLSVKWSACYIGAKTPQDCGNYYSWGEIETKTDFSWDTYKWLDPDAPKFLKYQSRSSVLFPEDDIATVQWGRGWRMPTKEEVEELVTLCKLTPKIDSVRNELVGLEVTGPSGKSIFLPSTGYYWLSEKVETSVPFFWTATGGDEAACAFTDSWVGSMLRDCGLPVRPVAE